MKSFLLGVAATLGVSALVSAGGVYFGMVDVSADTPHSSWYID